MLHAVNTMKEKRPTLRFILASDDPAVWPVIGKSGSKSGIIEKNLVDVSRFILQVFYPQCQISRLRSKAGAEVEISPRLNTYRVLSVSACILEQVVETVNYLLELISKNSYTA